MIIPKMSKFVQDFGFVSNSWGFWTVLFLVGHELIFKFRFRFSLIITVFNISITNRLIDIIT